MTPRAARSSAFDTPLMRQWREVKSRHPDDLVFFRVGDFYELFGKDAETGSALLGLTLTTRNNGAAQRVPLAGVPAKALDDYVDRLIRVGRKVVICDQVEDAAQAKGLVRREVVETVTPGTVVSDGLLEAGRNNFIVALAGEGQRIGVAAMDVSTGQLALQEASRERLPDELDKLEPSEILVAESEAEATPGTAPEGEKAAIRGEVAGNGRVQTIRPDWLFDPVAARDELVRRYRVHSLDGFGFEEGDEPLIRAAGALLAYVEEIRPGAAANLHPPRILRPGAAMTLDAMTRRNLELVAPLRPDRGGASLLSVLDLTRTAMGARLLRSRVLRPLVDAGRIRRRHGGVAELFDDPGIRSALRSALRGVRDLDRLAAKISSARAAPREIQALRESIRRLPDILGFRAAAAERPVTIFGDAAPSSPTPNPSAEPPPPPSLDDPPGSAIVSELLDGFDPLPDVADRIRRALADNVPATLADGGVIRDGFDPALDRLRELRDGAADFIAGLQARERERTGIASLKVGQNRVFGYYLEITHANRSRVPDGYIRKQTLTTAERYVTPELKEWEERIFEAEDGIARLERELFAALRDELAEAVPRIQETSRRVAALDVLAALAEAAERNGYVEPAITDDFTLDVTGGRHPVVEAAMPASDFIPNDLRLDEEGRIAIVTGPNMAGKSTVLRQTGLIQIMAQIGSFVPAVRAELAICDRIFTRVGAADDLARGQSTFMVEMNETAAIINGATERSLILLDEIGRGTSTYDGVSLAWAITEHLHDHLGAKAIFATHYHELTGLADLLPRVRNLNVSVREAGDEIIFLRRLEAGGADRSYGIHVARLAGLPPAVIARARQLLAELEERTAEGGPSTAPVARGEEGARDADEQPRTTRFGAAPARDRQLSLFIQEVHPVVERLRKIDPDAMTPLQALTELHAMHEAVKGEGG